MVHQNDLDQDTPDQLDKYEPAIVEATKKEINKRMKDMSKKPFLDAKGIVEMIKINYSDITFISELGRGGQATVYKANWKGMEVAVKMLNSSLDGTKDFSNFTQEFNIMFNLQHASTY